MHNVVFIRAKEPGKLRLNEGVFGSYKDSKLSQKEKTNKLKKSTSKQVENYLNEKANKYLLPIIRDMITHPLTLNGKTYDLINELIWIGLGVCLDEIKVTNDDNGILTVSIILGYTHFKNNDVTEVMIKPTSVHYMSKILDALTEELNNNRRAQDFIHIVFGDVDLTYKVKYYHNVEESFYITSMDYHGVGSPYDGKYHMDGPNFCAQSPVAKSFTFNYFGLSNPVKILEKFFNMFSKFNTDVDTLRVTLDVKCPNALVEDPNSEKYYPFNFMISDIGRGVIENIKNKEVDKIVNCITQYIPINKENMEVIAVMNDTSSKYKNFPVESENLI